MHEKNARSNREWPGRRSGEQADYFRLARQADARVAYHEAMSRKYWHLAGRPWTWIFIPPDLP